MEMGPASTARGRLHEGMKAVANVIGIDVGGTNTDAVLLRGDRIVGTAKVPTDPRHLVESTSLALEEVLRFEPGVTDGDLELHLSTTLSTNAIIENRGDATMVLVEPGPGMSLGDMEFPFPVFEVSGAIDHRGRETAALDDEEVLAAITEAQRLGVRAVAGVGKFSTRNPGHELRIEELVRQNAPALLPITLGHRLSGQPGFPRRITTAHLNASVTRRQTAFVRMVRELMSRRGLTGRVLLLKADGGTLGLTESAARPVETILSGPAASIMGAMALLGNEPANATLLDIGGTTTDIAVLASGHPLLERDGAEIAGHKTVVPALFSRPVGLGGDSVVRTTGSEIHIGPHREGPPAALGGSEPTPTDAVTALGLANIGDPGRAARAIQVLAEGCGVPWDEMARRIIDTFCGEVIARIEAVYRDLAERPVYTISEVLAPAARRPAHIIGMGAPAEVYIPRIAERMGLPWTVLPRHEVANAVGAAASHPTAGITFRADTALARLVVPELDLIAEIQRPVLFDSAKARAEAVARAREFAGKLGLDGDLGAVDILDEEMFHVVRGFHTVGRIFSIRAQIRPGVRRVVPGDH